MRAARAPAPAGRVLGRTLGALALLAFLPGCEQTFRDMYNQPRYKPLAASSLWTDGRSARPPVAGTVARSAGTFAGTTSGRLEPVEPAPAVDPLDALRAEVRPPGTPVAHLHMPPLTRALLERGRERFDIFCAPCHSAAGDGDGMVARRGFPHPPSFHLDRLRAASDAHFYAVMTYGYGAMHSYATRVPPDDRLAIVAYIRALQLSQHAPLEAVPADARARLDAPPAAVSGPR